MNAGTAFFLLLYLVKNNTQYLGAPVPKWNVYEGHSKRTQKKNMVREIDFFCRES